MWQPANKVALPTSEDLKNATKAITEVEAAIDEAKLRVLALQKDLEERKAWLAPIRKLPVEILSEIFISASELEDLAPVTIMEVCRLWHTVVLSTPRAWSLIYASGSRHAYHRTPYVSTFLERSRPCLLHITIPESVDGNEDSDDSEEEIPNDPVLFLMAHLPRIQCLTVTSAELHMLRQANMPNLTRLRILGAGEMIETFFINQSQFPRLQSVDSTSAPWAKSLPFTWFPPLQHLAIEMDIHFTWLDVGRNCVNTLKSLKIVCYERFRLADNLNVVFPKLESLTIEDWPSYSRDRDSPWTLQMLTPALTSYEELSSGDSIGRSVHGDVKNVTTLQSNRIHDLSDYVNLRVYQLLPSSGSISEVFAIQLAEQLDQNLNRCPALQMVLFLVLETVKRAPSESVQNRIIEPIKNARPGVEVVITNQFVPIPGSMEKSSVGIQFSACCR